MRMICGVTMGEIGSEDCEYCVSRRGCYAYKVAKEELMAQNSVAMIRATQSFDEERMRGKPLSSEKNSEKNPKQVLIDWVQNVENTANNLKACLKGRKMNSGYNSEREEALDVASDYVYELLGQCKAMMTVLKNSD